MLFSLVVQQPSITKIQDASPNGVYLEHKMASATDSVSIFAEGTFEEQVIKMLIFRRKKLIIVAQIQELLSYIVRNRSDEERATFISPFQNALKSSEGRKPIEEDEQRRKLILSKLLPEVKGLGDGSEKGQCSIRLL